MGFPGVPDVSERFAVASAHGRFQPVHNGHIEYLLAAKSRCDFLYVGLTQFVRSRLQDVSAFAHHRAELRNNPLTFFERQELLREALVDSGVSHDEFAVLPFPIEDEALLIEFLPLDIPVLTTVYDDWNREKVRRLRSAGYRVEVLWEREIKQYKGSVVRGFVANNDERYLNMVPSATARTIDRLSVGERLRNAGSSIL
jgi:cytidyltransferase-like protein